ncbi:hypothetical protein C8J57DRAFT_1286154 [Mycena rebaudengoi]|nr:hypothetical protein C8J57DRAFT_1286154 [Mycena rebaudengoi]
MLPASLTKDKKSLQTTIRGVPTFHLSQSDDGVSNGTGLWLGAQVLSAYLLDAGIVKPGMRAIELGGGIGLTALVLSHLGCNVITSDLPWVITKCLANNIESNLPRLIPGASGQILVRELDWTVPPDRWLWDHDTIIASQSCSGNEQPQPLSVPFDLIVTADTVYSVSLITPLLRTIHALCTLSMSLTQRRSPTVFICVERRDPAVVDKMLEDAKSAWGFTIVRVPPRKIPKAMEKAGIKWERQEWEGVEIWKLTLREKREVSATLP